MRDVLRKILRRLAESAMLEKRKQATALREEADELDREADTLRDYIYPEYHNHES